MDAIEALNDDELREQLVINGVDAPPVTATTRRVMERRLFRLIYDEPQQASSDLSYEESFNEVTPPKPSKTSSENIETSCTVGEKEKPDVEVYDKSRCHGLKVDADISGLFDRGDNLHAAGLVGPSYRRRPLHEETLETPSRSAKTKAVRQQPEPVQHQSNLTGYLLKILGLLAIIFVVYFVLNSDPFDANPALN